MTAVGGALHGASFFNINHFFDVNWVFVVVEEQGRTRKDEGMKGKFVDLIQCMVLMGNLVN